ncbi:MAG: hypothetical protein IPK82_07950 [Polyangiaceae bacterium]|nr:hypothetical protein [Polyangiaceae bacterium]
MRFLPQKLSGVFYRFACRTAFLLAPALAGCASSPALRAAEAHDLPTLAREIETEIKANDLTAAEARAIAKAVSVHAVQNAKGDSGLKTLEAYGRCSRVLDSAFEKRSNDTDEIAASAALTRLENGQLSPDDARESASRSGVHMLWRAVDARALIRPEDGAARRERLVDGDQEVRVAALRASADAGDIADADILADAARLDPYPLARTLAIRAIARTAMGERAVLTLRDLWTRADDDARQSIADAWATERIIDAGGRRELWWAAEHHHGAPAIAAAAALARFKGDGWSEAIGVLARAIESGDTKDRVFAIGVAPAHEQVIEEALRKAIDDKDDAVVVAVAWRLLSGVGRNTVEEKDRKALVAKLLEYAKSSTTRGFQAQKALAKTGVREVLPLLDKQIKLADTRARETTGVAYVDLGEAAKAAPLIADKDLGVRAAVACALVESDK